MRAPRSTTSPAGFRLILILTCLLLLCSSFFNAAYCAQDLQLIELSGKMIGPGQRAMGEFDYLTSGHKYRLMPNTKALLSNLDGSKAMP
jgi:hypothetical protein